MSGSRKLLSLALGLQWVLWELQQGLLLECLWRSGSLPSLGEVKRQGQPSPYSRGGG